MADEAVEAAMSAHSGAVDTAMIVVTTATPTARGGCLVGFHSASSIDPPRYSVWLSRANHTYKVGVFAEWFAVHFLTDDDVDLAERFGAVSDDDDVDKFAGLAWEPGPGGVPVLERCPNHLIGRRAALVDTGGDHTCVVLDPVSARSGGPFRPLRLSQLDHVDAGHDAEERQQP